MTPAKQMITFYLNEDLFGIEVDHVQEVTGLLPATPTPLAAAFVAGLINLRGQIATAINLKELFKISNANTSNTMSVVCRVEGNLLSFQVDRIGEVIDLDASTFELPPATISPSLRQFLKGVYKIQHKLICNIDVEKIGEDLFSKLSETKATHEAV